MLQLARSVALTHHEKWNGSGYPYGLAGEVDQTIHQLDMRGNIALVMGGEGDGLRRLTRETCDGLVRIPMPGDIESLNVSVATGIALFEAVRQRLA